MNSTGSTCLFADSAADAADRTDISCIFAFILVRTFYSNGISAIVQVDDVLRAFPCAAAAGDTFFFIYFCYTVFIQVNGTEFTAFYTFSTGYTAIGTAGAFCYMASSIAGYKSRTIWKFLFNSHD
jgi:hypothetical protein